MGKNFSPDYTGRYKIRFTTNGVQHSMTFRYAGDGAPSELFTDGVQAFLTTLAGWYSDDTVVTAASYAGRGSNTFLPMVNAPVLNGSLSAILVKPSDRAAFASFSGLTSGGVKARIVLMGFSGSADDATNQGDYRVTLTEGTNLAAVLAALRSIPELVAPDGLEVFWYGYMNLGFNAYFQRKLRG